MYFVGSSKDPHTLDIHMWLRPRRLGKNGGCAHFELKYPLPVLLEFALGLRCLCPMTAKYLPSLYIFRQSYCLHLKVHSPCLYIGTIFHPRH